MQIQFVDLQKQYQNIQDEINHAIKKVIESSSFIGGRFVEEFEQAFSDFFHAKYTIGVSNGTDALFLVLCALGVGVNDEVILPSHTFIATCEAIRLVGAKPVFVDIDEKTYTLDVNDVKRKINSKTKIIIPVHLYGYPADMINLENIAKDYNLTLLCDAAQAHGAYCRGKSITDFGVASTFSFYPGKNLGAYGDAGAIVTNDDQLASMLYKLRDHGRGEKYVHVVEGTNARLDALQAAILSVKLKYLQSWCDARLGNAKRYHDRLKEISFLQLPYLGAESERHAMHLYVIRVPEVDRNNLLVSLNKAGVQAGIHYPVPLHLQPCYKTLGYKKGDFPITEKVANEIISLPMCPELTVAQIDYIGSTIEDFYHDRL